MTRFLRGLTLAAALAAAGLYTWHWAGPAVRGQAGPCAVTVCCSGQSPAAGACRLEGQGLFRTLEIVSGPEGPEAYQARAEDLPPGEYRLLAGGVELARVVLTWDEPEAVISLQLPHVTAETP